VTNDPALALRLTTALEAERNAALHLAVYGRAREADDYDAAKAVTDALIEQVAR
jgi:hypothetical protein